MDKIQQAATVAVVSETIYVESHSVVDDENMA